ncbi:zinc ABC transporter ATP-binding protein AztA [Goodfellowiella coeruleoviolacea]|uniref:zinc ABC transporter ATP-binding protein AztA n=1 Tax=Goodfellowiella coeruleoviolacea TaxID=334858 RepID=UPI0020A43444|nr:zinc ABC transporter ATP-binding protein AztA [Goodfellowiella coeruleoviolacea]
MSAGYARELVLQRVTACVPSARATVVLGPNGSGKTTLLNVIAGVLAPVSGAVDRASTPAPAYVPQHSAVSDTLPMTVRDAVAMGRWARLGPWRRLSTQDKEIVDECLARLDIDGLATRKLGALSGGQRQRALVAQGLAQRSGLLLLDEPSTGLDLEAQRRIAEVLRQECAAGRTVVHTTHDLDEALRADHCLLLNAGRLVAQGAPADVLTEDTVRAVWHTSRPR